MISRQADKLSGGMYGQGLRGSFFGVLHPTRPVHCVFRVFVGGGEAFVPEEVGSAPQKASPSQTSPDNMQVQLESQGARHAARWTLQEPIIGCVAHESTHCRHLSQQHPKVSVTACACVHPPFCSTCDSVY
jgi:hypothetical protein